MMRAVHPGVSITSEAWLVVRGRGEEGERGGRKERREERIREREGREEENKGNSTVGGQ